MHYKNQYILTALFFIIIKISPAQTIDIKLADEYYTKGDYNKAAQIYEKIVRKGDDVSMVYENYLSSLKMLKEYSAAEKFLKKRIKSTEPNYDCRTDYAILLKLMGNESASDKYFDKVVNEIKSSSTRTIAIADLLVKRNELKMAQYLFLKSRKSRKIDFAYAKELADIYRQLGNKKLMIEEYLNMAASNKGEPIYSEQYLQVYLEDEEDFKQLEKAIYMRIQKDPTNLSYNWLLKWMYMQQLDFENAFIQAKAIDKRNRSRGVEILDVAEIAVENEDYEMAVEIYEYISDLYTNAYYRKLMINAKEELAKRKFPIDKTQIRSLIGDYKDVLRSLNDRDRVAEVKQSIARLYAFYLGELDTAETILTEVINTPRIKAEINGECRMDLGDIHVLLKEYGEAHLYYYQAEKIPALKNTRTAHLAKYKNAQLSYFKGDFELSKAHLDIIKEITDREISNNAIELSLLIQDNIGLDTTTDALAAYAAIELLIFQNQYEKALTALDDLASVYATHDLVDEIYWLRAKILKKLGRYEEAITFLEKIVSHYGKDIHADNAKYMLAEIYHYHTVDKEKAMQHYKELIINYPGSIFTAESRKRYRQLRGDKI